MRSNVLDRFYANTARHDVGRSPANQTREYRVQPARGHPHILDRSPWGSRETSIRILYTGAGGFEDGGLQKWFRAPRSS
jgi:hypothetical protein